MNSTPTLSTDQLTLRSPQAGDFPAYAAFFASERSTHEAGALGRAAARKEFASAVGFSAVAATLFLGGWALPAAWGVPIGAMHVLGPVIILAKALALTGVVFWVRFTLPRFREDQLQRFAWKFLIPLALANIAVTAVLKVAL